MKKNNPAFLMLLLTLFVIPAFFSSCSKTADEKKGLVIGSEKTFVMPIKCPGLAEPCLAQNVRPITIVTLFKIMVAYKSHMKSLQA